MNSNDCSGKVIARIAGGLGNQLFIYCAARRLALKNSVPLKLDTVSGFKWDSYERSYALGDFNIKADVASKNESYCSFGGRGRRYLIKKISQIRPFDKRVYLAEQSKQFDKRLLDITVDGTVYIDGYWQDERYFSDVESIVREDLKVTAEHSEENLELAGKIGSCNSVSLHVRRYCDGPNLLYSIAALPIEYYLNAITKIASEVKSFHLFCFADQPEWLRNNLKVDYPVTFVSHNNADKKNYEDLWLMSLCKHHIIANSTFSWWGSWLSENPEKIICSPDPESYKFRTLPIHNSAYMHFNV